MAFQQIRGRCRVSVKDIRHYKNYDYGIWIFIENDVFKSKYKPKAIKGNAVLIMQGTGKIQTQYTGTFTIQRCLRGEQFTQIKIQKD